MPARRADEANRYTLLAMKHALPACLLILTGGPVSAQWTAVRLQPEGALGSEARAVGPGIQGGSIRVSAFSNLPVLWHGSSANWTPLGSGDIAADVFGIWRDTQVGHYSGHACLWRGTPESRISLQPTTQSSEAHAVWGNMQVGYVYDFAIGAEHAALWRGTPASYVDLNPASANRSIANATDGLLQGGEVWMTMAPNQRAVLWNGTAASMTDLSGGRVSTIHGMVPGVQVGWVSLPGVGYHAAVWHGSAASFQDFNPPSSGSTGTRLFATTGRIHVGYGTPTGVDHALINFGTPEAWLDLNQFLPTGYSGFSGANGVYPDGPTIYVVGYAIEDATQNRHAFLWIGTDPCYANCDQSTVAPALNVNDFVCFIQHFTAGDGYANCDQSTTPPTLNVNDFVCFMQRFAQGCTAP
jgi:hypothetical protein